MSPTWSKIVELYRLTLPEEKPEQLKLNYNVAPTDVMPIILPAAGGQWARAGDGGLGLVPFWLKAEQLGQQPQCEEQPARVDGAGRPAVKDAAPGLAVQ